jgi:DNA-binding transcriptional LysR family regulator
MLQSVSFDQLRMFVAASDESSFSAAARSLQRTQSAISEAILSLEAQLGVVLFDRAGRYPRLTKEGIILLADARAVITGVDAMRARAKGIAGGLEAELTGVLDVFLPIEVIAEAAREFRIQFPATPLRLYVEALGGAVQPVLDGRASFGVVESLPTLPPGLIKERMFDVKLMMVAAASHPLASYRAPFRKRSWRDMCSLS